MEILERAQSLLDAAGYETSATPSAPGRITFEDANVYGFVIQLESVVEVLRDWEAIQDAFIRQHAVALNRVPSKAWNVYAVYLTTELCPPELRARLLDVEENFRGARKIARAGIKNRDAVDLALAPLLPLRHVVPLAVADVRERITQDPGIEDMVRDLIAANAPSDEIAKRLEES